MALLSRLMALAAKTEGVAGTAEALTATEAVFFAYLGPDAFTPEVPVVDRPALGGGHHQAAHGGRMGRLRFAVDFAGKGAAGNPYYATHLFPACGGSVSTQTWIFGYTASPCTIAALVNGTIRKLVGAVGTFDFELLAGQPARINFDMVGKIAADADTALLAPTYEAVVPPRWAANTFALGGYTMRASRLAIALGATTRMLEDITDATGYKNGIITDILPTLDCDPEADLQATKDWQALLYAGTTGALSTVLGTAANNIVTITQAAVQVIEETMGDRDGLVTRQLGLRPTWTGASGTTPLQIVYT